MKVTTEKLPRSLLALDIELDNTQVEKGLDRAARRISQKYNIPGFRKGKAPRFIVENYFGRETLLQEATEDLINNAFKKAVEQENIEVIGPPDLADFKPPENPSDSIRFRVTVPVPPSVTLPDYRAIQLPLEFEPVTDEMVERALEMRREKHVVLRELDEPRSAQAGDQLTVKMQTFVDGEALEQYEEGEELPESTLVLEENRLVPELYERLLGVNVDEEHEVTARMPEDHPNERVSDKDVTFKVRVVGIQERLLPDWDELPTLEEFEGTLDELRAETHQNLQDNMRDTAEQELVQSYIDQLVEQTTFDYPDVMVRNMADTLLEEQGRQFARYGVTIDQLLEYQGQTREDAIEDLLEPAESRLKEQLVLYEVISSERLDLTQEEVQQEATSIINTMDEQTVQTLAHQQDLSQQFLSNVANSVLNRKLQERLIAIATGQAPDLDQLKADEIDTDADSEAKPDQDTIGQETQERSAPAETVQESDEAASPESDTGGKTSEVRTAP